MACICIGEAPVWARETAGTARVIRAVPSIRARAVRVIIVSVEIHQPGVFASHGLP
ncbi:hypothetical protein D3C72_1660490 [compost metagenome]